MFRLVQHTPRISRPLSSLCLTRKNSGIGFTERCPRALMFPLGTFRALLAGLPMSVLRKAECLVCVPGLPTLTLSRPNRSGCGCLLSTAKRTVRLDAPTSDFDPERKWPPTYIRQQLSARALRRCAYPHRCARDRRGKSGCHSIRQPDSGAS